MKQTPQERKIRNNFESGTLTKCGFLGHDTRHIHEIIKDDERILLSLKLNCEKAADTLAFFMEQGKSELEGCIDVGTVKVQTQWDRGMIPCPFGDTGLHPKIITTVIDKRTKSEIKYSELSIHLIRKHGFFGGKGSPFRVEPEECLNLYMIGFNKTQ
jgi:hypothetical protein